MKDIRTSLRHRFLPPARAARIATLSIPVWIPSRIRHHWMARFAILGGALHKAPELKALLELADSMRPKDVVEIGLGSGSTFRLWPLVVHPDARITGIDRIAPDIEFEDGISQTTRILTRDSQTEAARDEVASIHPDGIDFLFIDGDHSFDGVRRDFELYGPFVRNPGIIAFHDINRDHRHLGINCVEDSGEVYQLWDEIKNNYRHEEFVADRRQSGYGIGVLFIE